MVLLDFSYFSIILPSIPVSPSARRRTDQGGIEPHHHPMATWYISLKIAQNRPRRPPQLGGEVPQNCPCFPILSYFAMSNFAMPDSWLS
jgi:hypothetical protein